MYNNILKAVNPYVCKNVISYMKKLFLPLLSLLYISTVFAPVKHSITKSSVTFQIKNLGVYTNGSFSGVKGDIDFAPAHLDASSIEASVDVITINTGNDSRDDHLKSDSYFDVAKYPKITIRSVSFKHKGGNNFTGVFNLTIKDKTNQVELPFVYTDNGSTAIFKGILKIDRTDYGVGGSSLIMSADVNISINVEADKGISSK
jgi:polyisoprenoid-binding protein YceI